MHADSFLLLCGALVFAVPFMQVREEWTDVALFSLGFLVMAIAFGYRLVRRKRMRREEHTYHVDHNPRPANDTAAATHGDEPSEHS